MLKNEQYEPINGICDRCNKERKIIDISDNPIHITTLTREHIDINIICANCLKYFLNRMRRMMGEPEIA